LKKSGFCLKHSLYFWTLKCYSYPWQQILF